MTACQKAMEVYSETMEENPVEIKSIAVHEEFYKEDVAVKPVGGRRNRHRGWNLAMECR
jgi:hypothetical protein